jgi:hypothetical protein
MSSHNLSFIYYQTSYGLPASGKVTRYYLIPTARSLIAWQPRWCKRLAAHGSICALVEPSAAQDHDGLVGVAEPKANQVFWRMLLPEPRRAKPPEAVSTRFRLSQVL